MSHSCIAVHLQLFMDEGAVVWMYGVGSMDPLCSHVDDPPPSCKLPLLSAHIITGLTRGGAPMEAG